MGPWFSEELNKDVPPGYFFGEVCWVSPPIMGVACSLQPSVEKAVSTFLWTVRRLGTLSRAAHQCSDTSHKDLPTKPHLLLTDPECSCGHGGRQ
jgi:hypothetical protein